MSRGVFRDEISQCYMTAQLGFYIVLSQKVQYGGRYACERTGVIARARGVACEW